MKQYSPATARADTVKVIFNASADDQNDESFAELEKVLQSPLVIRGFHTFSRDYLRII